MMDTQDRKPDVMEELQKVGVSGLRTIVQTNWKGVTYRFIPSITLTINLPKEKKGAHMSRLVEAISEAIEEQSHLVYCSLEELERHMLESLGRKHAYSSGEVEMSTQLVVEKKTPVSKKTTMETYDVSVSTMKKNGAYNKRLAVKAVGSTACPHAMEHSNGRPHIQRAEAVLTVETGYENKLELEDMIATAEKGFSSEAYTLLKTEDERAVVEKMHKNPRFVEDACREILAAAKRKYRKSLISVKVTSQESIHPHNVTAEATAKT
jgi:GTP cyclohydrolase-4